MTRHFLRVSRVVVAGVLLVLFCACHGDGGSPTPPSPSFSLTVAPAALSVPAGGGGYATVTILRSGGFGDAVTLSLEGAPAGLLGSGTVAASAQTGQLSLIIARAVAPQSLDTLRVKGTSGTLTQTSAFKLVVAPPLPVGQIGPDLVQASGGVQRVGTMENTGMASEPLKASTSKDAGGNLEVRHGFIPSAKAN